MNKILGAVVIFAVIIGGYFYSKHSSPVQAVTLGVIAGTTGQYAPAGEGYVQGFNLAMEEWNKSHTEKFSAVVEDDGFTAEKGLTAYKKLNSVDKVDAYAILSSFTIDAVYQLVHTESRPVALGFEQSKQAENDNIFQVIPAARPVESALGKKVKELGFVHPVAAVSNNTSVYQNFYAGFNEGYGSSVNKFDIGSDITGIRSQALAIINSKPDVVAFFMAPKDGALLVKEILKIAGQKPPYLVFDQSIQSGSADYKNILGSDIQKINGSIVAMSKNDFTDDFATKFKKKYNTLPPFGSDMGYNSFMLLATTHDNNSQTWIKNMREAKFTGADGIVSFDSAGLRVPNVFFAKLQNGSI